MTLPLKKTPLRKTMIVDDLTQMLYKMNKKPEWSTVHRHLTRALIAVEDLVTKSKK